MPVPIERGENFYSMTFGDLSLPDDLREHREIAPKIWAGRGFPVIPGEHWEKWLGEIAFRSIRAGLVITVVGQQQQPGQIVNPSLKLKLDNFMFGIILQGIPSFRESFMIAGSNEQSEPDARSFGRTRWPLYPTAEMPWFNVGHDQLTRAVFLYGKLEIVNLQGPNWRRLRRAIETVLRGSAEPTLQDERTHQFARALEGLILPDKGATRKQFVRRCQTFLNPAKSNEETLGQIFDIRSQLEHLHNALDVLPGATTDDRVKLLFRRARQADALARFALSRTLEDDLLRETFKKDESISVFWNKTEAERSRFWGMTLDFEAIT